ncbi:MAG: hypothetical protein ACOCY8_02980, partial [Spirochaetota bacterium]
MSARHLARAPRVALVTAALALLTLGGCGGAIVNGYYLLPTARTSYIYEDFGPDDSGEFELNAEQGYSPDGHDVVDGHFVAWLPRQFARTRGTYPTSLEVRVEWAIWSPDPMVPVSDNGEPFDFRIVLDSSDDGLVPSGVWVSLKLFQAAIEDVLQVGDDASGSVATASRSTVEPTSASLRATFNRMADPPVISAKVVDSAGDVLLETSLPLDGGWPADARV